MAGVEDILDMLLDNKSGEEQQPNESGEESVEEISSSDGSNEFDGSNESDGSEPEDAGINLGEIFSLFDTYKEVMGEIKTDERAQLIKAIKPFLSDERQTKAENCLKFLSITRFMDHKEEFSKLGSKFLPV